MFFYSYTSIIYINNLIIQQLFSEKEWKNRLEEDYRTLTSVISSHNNLYDEFCLDMDKRMAI
ncbi:hypothetical protein COD89_22165 [Bacillus thuringiensis]|nr:hypothetical protein CON12_19425 [Bacillus thuringiensis]PGV55738.1 hypothetical protein COD89_22165 [Bacillus thuringiensis]